MQGAANNNTRRHSGKSFKGRYNTLSGKASRLFK